jgi:CheY-like chemotaxis protein
VLVAEDNIINRKLLATQLEKLGCRYRMVGNGEEMLAILQQSPLPDVILTDCEMPDLDGREATKHLRKWGNQPGATEIQRKAATLPVIALTGSASTVGRAQCFEAGMTDFLSKPAKLTDLQRVLQSIVPNVPGATGKPDPHRDRHTPRFP